MAENEGEVLLKYLNEKAVEFDKLCMERHTEGQTKYGEITFLGNDVVRMLLEELADTTNYCRMQAIKLLALQEQLEVEMGDKLDNFDGEITMGFQAFKGTKDVGWKK